MVNDEFESSLHIIPLDPKSNSPILFFGDGGEGNIVAVSENGRIVGLPLDTKPVLVNEVRTVIMSSMVNAIENRIGERFPDGNDISGNPVAQYLAVGVMVGDKKQGWIKFIFEVWGFKESFAELNIIYDKICSIKGLDTGSVEYKEIVDFLATDPLKEWINELIIYLKEQLNWAEYVKRAVNVVFSDTVDNLYAVSFRGGDFNIRKKSDVSLWCIDNNQELCLLILTQATYRLIDTIITEYAKNSQVVTTVGCKYLDTENPIIMPAMMSLETYKNYALKIAEYVENKLTPPKDLSKTFLDNVTFVQQDEVVQAIKLIRSTKDPQRGDMFTRNTEGKRIEIYVTHLLKTDKPFSNKEINLFKFKHLFKL
jgi:hypothetical protein